MLHFTHSDNVHCDEEVLEHTITWWGVSIGRHSLTAHTYDDTTLSLLEPDQLDPCREDVQKIEALHQSNYIQLSLSNRIYSICLPTQGTFCRDKHGKPICIPNSRNPPSTCIIGQVSRDEKLE